MRRISFFILSIILCACSVNLYDDFADKDTSEALYFEAKQEINNRNYTAAITLFDSIEASFLAERERVPVHASAHAGRCGLDFLALLTNLQNSSGGSNTVFTTLMGAFPGALTANAQDCIDAETIMDTIGDDTVRNGDENLFMAFVALSKIGTILSSLADTDDDSTADATFDQCNDSDFPEAMVRELGAGLAVALLSLAAVGTSYVDDTVTEVTDLCAVDANLARFCTTTDPAAFTALEVQAMRYLIGSSDIGIDSCGGNNFNDCVLANPACP